MSASEKAPLIRHEEAPQSLVPERSSRHNRARVGFGISGVIGLGGMGFGAYVASEEFPSISPTTIATFALGTLVLVVSLFGYNYSQRNRREEGASLNEVRVEPERVQDLTEISREVQPILQENGLQDQMNIQTNPQEQLIAQIRSIDAFIKRKVEDLAESNKQIIPLQGEVRELRLTVAEKERIIERLQKAQSEPADDATEMIVVPPPEMAKLKRDLARTREELDEKSEELRTLKMVHQDNEARLDEYEQQIEELGRLNEMMKTLHAQNAGKEQLAEATAKADKIHDSLNRSFQSRSQSRENSRSFSATPSPLRPSGGVKPYPTLSSSDAESDG